MRTSKDKPGGQQPRIFEIPVGGTETKAMAAAMDGALKPLMEANLLSQLIELAGLLALLRTQGVAPQAACEQQVSPALDTVATTPWKGPEKLRRWILWPSP